GQELQGAADDGIEVRHDCAEPAAQYPPFSLLPTEQRHLLAVFAQAGQREPKIGLVALLAEFELNEWLADQMGQPSADERKDQSDPKRQPGDGDLGSRYGEVGRDRP